MEQATLQRRVRIIPATKQPRTTAPRRNGKQRVAAYCRVSTDSEEQLNSYAAQKTYYTQKIEENPDLNFHKVELKKSAWCPCVRYN